MITHDELLQDLFYNKDTGIFTWRINRYRVTAGQTAGSIGHGGYIYITVRRTRSLAHRLAWFYTTGTWPKAEIDHVNGDVADNRLSNLREATISQNRSNRIRKKPGLKGAYFNLKNGRKPWRSQITLDGKAIIIGCYSTEAEAHAAYCERAAKLRGEFFCNGIRTARLAQTDT